MGKPRTSSEAGQGALQRALGSARGGIIAVALFSLFVNLLALTGPLFMMQVYDRVLASRSVPTLAAIGLLVAVLFLTLGLLDLVRGRLMNRIAIRIDRRLDAASFEALMRRSLRQPSGRNELPLLDLAALRRFLTGPAPLTLFDIPWAPVFLAVVFLMHWTLGLVALAGSLLLFALAVANELRQRTPLGQAALANQHSQQLAAASQRNAEALAAMGMQPALRRRWLARHAQARRLQGRAADRARGFTASTKTIRLALQSAILGAGALLAIEQTITPGMMIAASIIVGRALAPVEQAVGQWRGLVSARGAWGRLKALLAAHPLPKRPMALPAAAGALTLEQVSAGPPGVERPFLRDISLALSPGEALGIIGPSAAGKSTLARVLTGVWPTSTGCVRLDGADIAGWDRDDLGPQIGYLPQDVELFAGKVSENIGRFREDADPELIVAAARSAGVHEMILRLPEGYDSEIGDGGCHLSAGQRQRVALARALYGSPALVVLDEPNANLDAAGDEALTAAVETLKAQRRTVVVITHRPSGIAAVDKLLILDGGRVGAFGPKDEVLRRVIRPAGGTRPGTAALRAV